jgi:hypothetical protein
MSNRNPDQKVVGSDLFIAFFVLHFLGVPNEEINFQLQ